MMFSFPAMARSTLAVAALVTVFAPSRPVHAQDAKATAPVASAMAEAANKVIAALTPEQKAKVVLAFDDPSRVDWTNIPKPTRKGVQLREMSAEQQKLCHELLKVTLSDQGYEKAVRIMSLESNLNEGEKNLKNGPIRDPQRYFLTIFGQPSDAGNWGWSFEGHHFSLNFVIRDGQVTAETPSFWGANPATVKIFVEGGPKVGTRTLADEEQLAFQLVKSLDAQQSQVAIIADKAPNEYRAAGKPQPPQSGPEGLPAKKMTDEQKATLKGLVKTYIAHWADPIAQKRLAEIEAAGWDDVHFAWLGATEPGVGHSYRIHGPTFILELINVQSDPAGNPANHIHSVWRDPRGDFSLTLK